MKKLFLLAVVLYFACGLQAQLLVDSTGYVSIPNNLGVQGTQFISTSGSRCLQLSHSSSTIHRKMALLSQTSHTSGTAYNLYCATADQTTDSNTPGRAIGIYSTLYSDNPYAGSDTPGARYGICGMNSHYGAAIYGATSGTYVALSQPYAGYFYGNTHVQGNLSVSGNISGVILSNGSTGQLSTMSPLSEGDGSLGRRLQSLKAERYYIKCDQEKLSDDFEDKAILCMADNNDSVDMDILEDRLPLGNIEKQAYAKQHYGLSVNELEEVFPDLVYENEDGTKSINYVEMVPILVQAINELSAKVEALESGNSSAKKIESRNATDVDGMGENVAVLALGQNKPNPFGTSTSIDVSLPNDVKSAFIYVYDLTGKKLHQIDVTSRGKQAVTINASSLADGMYLYSLIADGKVVETRRMIVEK